MGGKVCELAFVFMCLLLWMQISTDVLPGREQLGLSVHAARASLKTRISDSVARKDHLEL